MFQKTLAAMFVFLFFGFGISACKTTEEVSQVKPGSNTRDQFKSLFHDGMSEKMIGNYDRAILLFEQCLLIEPENAAVHFVLSDLYEIQGNFPKAIQYGNSAFELDKTNKWYGINLAQLYFKTGEYEKSASCFELVMTDEEQSLELKYQYAEALINSKQYAKAIVVLDDIEIETGKFPELSLAKHDMYMILGEPEKAKLEIDLLLSQNPRNVEYRLTIGNYYLDTDQFEKARAMGQEIITLNPEFGEGYFLLGDVEMHLNQIQKAMDFYLTGFSKEDISIERKLYLINRLMPMAFNFSRPESKIVERGLADAFKIIYNVDLKNPALHIAYGDFLLKSGDGIAALEQYRIVCDLNSADFGFWNQILALELKLHDYSNLFSDSQKALELFPSQPEFYLYAGIGASESGKFTEAEEFLFLGKDFVINNSPLLAEFYSQLGVMECKQKKNAEGYSYFEEAKKINPSEARIYGLKAKYLFLEGKITEAETEINKGISINPNSIEILYVQGMILISKKDYQQAVDVLGKATGKDSDNFEVLELYGDALYLNGQKEDALIIWQESLRKGNQSELLKRKIADKTYYEN